ncbi:MAG: MiaB/RimO family radical SAM methylthiotransferase [bacterium]|nr:MiaB/RimO family radical SAM methylthiotransferase [bacterium]MDT8366648.1 MiaB/RimO family radical SAM methylthiotransferase [bacterium]
MTFNNNPGPKGPGIFSFITLGCKSNQYDSAAMAAELELAGLSRGSVSEAHVIVVNTCMVTGPTEAQCRKAIRQARRANAGAKLVVSGCMTSGARETIETMEEVDLVIEPSEKGMLPGLLGIAGSVGWWDWPEDPAVDLGDRDRGFLKLQDGCNANCTYCVVPLARGRSRSLKPDLALGAVGRLMDRGVSEVVLSGIHLGQYGADLQPVSGLEDLLARLLENGLPGRLRLSSIEPLEITPRLVETMANAGGRRICRHIHIPLQSGSNRVLKEMGRPYLGAHFADAVRLLRNSIPGIGIGCDVICGFPGESEEDFNKTHDLVEKLQIPFIHAFPFSPRAGTKAAAVNDDVPHQVKKKRVLLMRELAQTNWHLFASSFVGEVLQTAIESTRDDFGRLLGLSDNYLRVAVRTPHEGVIPGRIVDVLIERTDGDILEGRLMDS